MNVKRLFLLIPILTFVIVSSLSVLNVDAQTENKSDELENATTNQVVEWQTYEDGENGFKIQYPQEWKKIGDPERELPERSFTVNLHDIGTEVSVDVENASRTLDPATLKMKLLPLEHHADKLIAGLPSILEGSSVDVLTDEAVTFSGEPAWRVDYIFNYEDSQLYYGSTILVIKDDKLYEITFRTDPFKVEEVRPIGEKIIQAFQFTNNTAKN